MTLSVFLSNYFTGKHGARRNTSCGVADADFAGSGTPLFQRGFLIFKNIQVFTDVVKGARCLQYCRLSCLRRVVI